MHTHVIILAQGQQRRLPKVGIPKQLLELPGYGLTILERTIRQVVHLRWKTPRTSIVTVCERDRFTPLPEVAIPHPWSGPEGYTVSVGVVELSDPGNSSLKGLTRYLAADPTGALGRRDATDHTVDRVVVLLGDVVYSWACLRVLFGDYPFNMMAAGTSDISPSRGELWGLGWRNTAHPAMRDRITRALSHHPPFRTYQCGQLRRVLWERANVLPAWYERVDDYTRDIDTPEHLEMLPELAAAAEADDARELGVSPGNAAVAFRHNRPWAMPQAEAHP